VKRVYVSGPMSGLPEFNYPAFFAAADRLREAGHEPVNPAEIGQRPDWDWHDYMNAIKMQKTCEGIYLLPGWRQSRGAVVEYYVALALGQRVWGAAA